MMILDILFGALVILGILVVVTVVAITIGEFMLWILK